MNQEYETKDFNIKKAAIYQIVIKGEMDSSKMEKLGEMKLHKTNGKGTNLTSSLTGRIADQAALVGILNMLYEWRFAVLSVEMISEIN